MTLGYTPPPVTEPLRVWAQNVVTYLQRTASRLAFRRGDARATEDGVILWDEINGYPVVSKGGEYRQIILGDGLAVFNQDADITAPAINTAYKIALDQVAADGIALTGTPLTEITFVEGGLYLLAFTAQCSSTAASTVNFRFWPRINGADLAGSTIVASLHNNGATMVTARSAIFTVAAGDVLNVMWAVDTLTGYLHAHPATAYAPAAPSVTLASTRIKA